MCEFQSLYFNDDGYVVCCTECGIYQVAFISTVLTLTESNFEAFCKVVNHKCSEEDCSFIENSKNVAVPSPAYGIYMLLTRSEAQTFKDILEEADNEVKALALIDLFKQ